MSRRKPKLEDALLLAIRAHQGQKDKAGAPYILHPIRVMLQLDSEIDRIVAILHDVVEDTRFTLNDLKKRGYSASIVKAVNALTRREGEAYEDFVKRAGLNPIARKVKLADLRDNMNLTRIKRPTERDRERLKRYRKAYKLLS